MAPVVERREHSRRHSPDKPVARSRRSPHKSSPRGDRPPPPGSNSPIARSPNIKDSSYRRRSPQKEKLPDRLRSPKQIRRRSPSSPPSPDTKKIRDQGERESSKFIEREHVDTKKIRDQGERESSKFIEREHVRNSIREEQDKGRRKERGDVPSQRRSLRDINDDELYRSSRRDNAISSVRNHNKRYSSRSRSPPRTLYTAARDEVSMSRTAEQHGDGNFDSVSKMKATEDALEAKEKDKQKPSFELSGKLAEETNKVRGITLLFTEPSDACKPDVRWRLYVFKSGEVLNEPLYVHRQSCYLFGRERRVADIPTDHPSCSKQHAVLQYRGIDKEQSDGLIARQVRPYLMDLGSTNGTFINENRIEPQRYYELFEKDTIKFGNSSREYVMLHENSAG